jgi:hypothetical protein
VQDFLDVHFLYVQHPVASEAYQRPTARGDCSSRMYLSWYALIFARARRTTPTSAGSLGTPAMPTFASSSPVFESQNLASAGPTKKRYPLTIGQLEKARSLHRTSIFVFPTDPGDADPGPQREVWSRAVDNLA